MKIIWFFWTCLFACTPSGNKRVEAPTTFTFRLPSEPPALLPVRGIDNISIDMMNNLLEGLFEFDAQMRAQPKLVERFTVSADGKSYHFWLRKNVTWSDGVPFVAQQVVDSWKMILDPKSESEYAYLLFPVTNAQRFHLGEEKDFKNVGVRADGAGELIVQLSAPLPYFTQLLAVVVTFPMRVDLFKKYGEAWTEPGHLTTLGPYLLTKWEHDRELVFEVNPKYWGPPPFLKKIIAQIVPDATTALNLFESGKLDLVRHLSLVDVPRFAADPRYHVVPYFRNYYVAFRVTDPLVSDVHVREALARAIDRRVIAKVIKGGQQPTASFIPEGMLGYDARVGMAFDPVRARQLWTQYKPKNSGHFKIYFDQREDNKTIMESLQQQWKSVLGLDVELEAIEWKVYLGRMRAGLGPLFRYGWGADFPDPDNFMTVFFSAGGNNLTGWKNADYDRLVLRAQRELDETRRAALYREAQRTLLEKDVVILPLFTESLNFVLQPRWHTLEFDRMSNLFFNRIHAAP